MNKTAVVIATVLTTLVLLSVAGLVYTVQGSVRQAEAQGATPAGAQSLSPEIQQREAQYQAMIEEANQRLLQAESTAQANPALTGQTQAAINPERAAEVASAALGRQDVYSIEALPEAGGGFHYQVTFSSGDVVQVSTAGQILDVQSPQTLQARAGDDEYEDDDHEDYEDHDDDDDDGVDDDDEHYEDHEEREEHDDD